MNPRTSPVALLLCVASLSCVSPAGPLRTPSARAEACPADSSLAKLVAGSQFIFAGTPLVSPDRVLAAQRSPTGDYFAFSVAGVEMLRGEALGDPVEIRVFGGDRDAGSNDQGPAEETILAASGERSILFVVEGGGRAGEYYFAGWTPLALQPATAPNIAAIRSELARQAEIAVAPSEPDLPHAAQVRSLIDRLVAVRDLAGGRDAKRQAQQTIFRELEALGPVAVRAIVAQMDDRRPLAVGQITFVNKNPGAWEGLLHYGPDLVVDALDAILGQITGAHGITIVNGGTESQRRVAVAGWHVYVHDRSCSDEPKM